MSVVAPYVSSNMCNKKTIQLAEEIAKELEELGCKTYVSYTPVISDGQSMGSTAMRYFSLKRGSGSLN